MTILSNPRQKTLHVGVDDFLSGGINLRLLFYSGEGWWTIIESIPKKNMFEAKRLNDQAVLDQKAAEECAADEAAKKEENSEGSSNSKFFNR
ncbi:hypothetical protein I4J19_09630 [Corynebacterium diphtheriae bv. mitis]|nr:hypothetical protein [Corynebacterium diphtheriae bv. mitis]MBG9361842.1 hypothetical protein [Corynebacterium diphtheriae bv. mitis]MBG9364007.1 hypothetical protein [Corynebacterium diphtheriae bv. mitis]MBG9365524.1 hypothetical protein [Corynebacterium diphtheriae bv. mitis]